MQITDVLAQAQGGRIYDNIAHVYGMEPAEVEAVANNVIPVLALGIERNTLSRGGLADTVSALGDGHHQLYLQDPRFIGSEVMVNDGNEILGHILGSVDRSRYVADKVAAVSGVDSSWVRKLLPILAALLMGALSKQSSGGLGDILKRLPGGGDNPGLPSGGDLSDILRRMGVPIPGSDGPVNDDGGRRGGARGDGDANGGGLGDIFRRIPGLPGSRDDSGGGSDVPGLPSSGGSIPGIPDAPRRGTSGGSVSTGGNSTGGSSVPQKGGTAGGQDNPFNLPGGLGDILNKIPGMGGQADKPGGTGQWGGQASPAPSPGRTARAPQPFPDQGGGSGSPLPLPGERMPNSGPRDNPYGDLSDIIRNGKLPDGVNLPGGGSLGNVVRDILGGNLGFKGRGLLGWIIQFFIYRWGWSILKRILGGVLGGGRR